MLHLGGFSLLQMFQFFSRCHYHGYFVISSHVMTLLSNQCQQNITSHHSYVMCLFYSPGVIVTNIHTRGGQTSDEYEKVCVLGLASSLTSN